MTWARWGWSGGPPLISMLHTRVRKGHSYWRWATWATPDNEGNGYEQAEVAGSDCEQDHA